MLTAGYWPRVFDHRGLWRGAILSMMQPGSDGRPLSVRNGLCLCSGDKVSNTAALKSVKKQVIEKHKQIYTWLLWCSMMQNWKMVLEGVNSSVKRVQGASPSEGQTRMAGTQAGRGQLALGDDVNIAIISGSEDTACQPAYIAHYQHLTLQIPPSFHTLLNPFKANHSQMTSNHMTSVL